MSVPALDNLVRIGQLKAESRNDAETKRMLAMARTRLAASPAPTTLPMQQLWTPFAGLTLLEVPEIGLAEAERYGGDLLALLRDG